MLFMIGFILSQPGSCFLCDLFSRLPSFENRSQNLNLHRDSFYFEIWFLIFVTLAGSSMSTVAAGQSTSWTTIWNWPLSVLQTGYWSTHISWRAAGSDVFVWVLIIVRRLYQISLDAAAALVPCPLLSGLCFSDFQSHQAFLWVIPSEQGGTQPLDGSSSRGLFAHYLWLVCSSMWPYQ